VNERIEVWILAGGLSSRMGRDKGRMRLHGKELLARIRAEARKTGWPVRVLRKDAVKRCGPIGGVYTALKGSKAEAVLFLACDMPFVSVTLLQRVGGGLSMKTKAVFVRHDRRATFPFVLRSDVVEEVRQQIATGDFSLQTLARNLRAKFVRAKGSELFDLDTPEDVARARKVCSSGFSRQRVRTGKRFSRRTG
jgi:molybdenum cofactor guanylyltransferase